jgi:hypothetical protein
LDLIEGLYSDEEGCSGKGYSEFMELNERKIANNSEPNVRDGTPGHSKVKLIKLTKNPQTF